MRKPIKKPTAQDQTSQPLAEIKRIPISLNPEFRQPRRESSGIHPLKGGHPEPAAKDLAKP